MYRVLLRTSAREASMRGLRGKMLRNFENTRNLWIRTQIESGIAVKNARNDERRRYLSMGKKSAEDMKGDKPRSRPGQFEIFTYDEDKVFVLGHFPGGFKVNNTSHDGPMILLPNLCMQWAVASLADVTVESMIVSSLIHPIPEVFVLGTGPTSIPPLKESDWYQEGDDFKNLSDFRDTLNEQGTQLEILDSVNACATFNILNAENRRVAGAFLPVTLSG